MLLVSGLLIVYSASFAIGYLDYGDTNYFVARQAVFSLIGLGLMLLFMRMDYHHLRRLSVVMMAVAIIGLLAVLVPGLGVEKNGASRWLDLGIIELQPSEFAKLAVIVYVSAWLASRGQDIKKFSLGFLPFVLMVALVGGLIVIEPDMGTTIIVLLIASTLFFMAGAPLSHLALLVVAAALISGALVLVQDYRLDRLAAFFSAEADPQGSGFQVLQLLIALGSGGPAGLGWGVSRQKFFYVPGAHTDGVFAILGEELGFIGTIAILCLFAFFLYRGFKIVTNARDQFGVLLAVGVISWIGYQAIINIAGITRTIPLTGVPLPFMSYGGSALVSLLASVGILLSVSRYGKDRGSVTDERPNVNRRLPWQISGKRTHYRRGRT